MIHAKKMMVHILSSQLTRIFHERYFDRHFNSRRQSTTGCLCFAAEICLVMGFESFDKVKGLIVLSSIYFIKEVSKQVCLSLSDILLLVKECGI